VRQSSSNRRANSYGNSKGVKNDLIMDRNENNNRVYNLLSLQPLDQNEYMNL
jgi:hypothetical protein